MEGKESCGSDRLMLDWEVERVVLEVERDLVEEGLRTVIEDDILAYIVDYVFVEEVGLEVERVVVEEGLRDLIEADILAYIVDCVFVEEVGLEVERVVVEEGLRNLIEADILAYIVDCVFVEEVGLEVERVVVEEGLRNSIEADILAYIVDCVFVEEVGLEVERVVVEEAVCNLVAELFDQEVEEALLLDVVDEPRVQEVPRVVVDEQVEIEEAQRVVVEQPPEIVQAVSETVQAPHTVDARTADIILPDRSRINWNYVRIKTLFILGGISTGYITSVAGGVDVLPVVLFATFPGVYKARAITSHTSFCIFWSFKLIAYMNTFQCGAIIGSFVPLLPIRRWGRRSLLLTSLFGIIIGGVVYTFCPNIRVKFIGRGLVGLSTGVLTHVPSMYEEVLPKDSRYAWSTSYTWFIQLGTIIACLLNLLASYFQVWGYFVSLGFPVLPAIILVIVVYHLPEPFSTFIERYQIDDALQGLRVVRGGTDVTEEFSEMLRVGRKRRTTNSVREILRRRNRPTLTISIVTALLSRLIGADLYGFYMPFILQSLGYEQHEAYLGTFVLSLAQLVSQAIGVFLIRLYGRRKVYGVACVLMMASLITLCIDLERTTQNPQVHLRGPPAPIAIVSALVYNLSLGVLPGPLGWLHTTYPDECAQLGGAFTSGLGFLIGCTASFGLFPTLCKLQEWMLVVCAMCLFILISLIGLFLPETYNVPNDEMPERVWRRHWCWRYFF